MENNNSAIGITSILIDFLNKKYDNIRDLDSLVVNLVDEEYDSMVPVIDSIIEDENNHIGKIQQLIDLLSGSGEDIEEGKQDTLDIIDNNEFMESIKLMKRKKLVLSENFDNVIDDVQAVADPVFVGANEEHDENKKRYDKAMKENRKEADETVKMDNKEVKSKALKSMHLSEKLFDEAIVEDLDFKDYINKFISKKASKLNMDINDVNKNKFIDKANKSLIKLYKNNGIVSDKEQLDFVNRLFNRSFTRSGDYYTEDLSFDNYSDFNSAVYNAISDVCFKFSEKDLSKKDIEAALEWFETHFFEDDDFEFLDIEEENIEESFNRNNLKEDFNKKLWVDWYKLFGIIADKYFPDEDLIRNKVDTLYKLFEFEPGMKEAYRRWNEWNDSPIDESLNESFVAEWWGQVDGDTPQTVAKTYNLSVKPIKRKQDEVLYKFEGNLKDFSKALDDGYFYSLIVQQDAGHSKDIDSLLNESLKYSIAKEQIKRFTEGKMPKNWDVDSYLKKLVEHKHINRKESKSLKEWYDKIK